MRSKFRPLGHKEMMKVVEEGFMLPHGQLTNERKCNCKVCGKSCSKSQGARWQLFRDELEVCNPVYLCEMCNAYWLDYIGYEANADLIDEYRKHFNIKVLILNRKIQQTPHFDFIVDKVEVI